MFKDFKDLMHLPGYIVDVLNRKCGNLIHKEYIVSFQSLCEIQDDYILATFTFPDQNKFLYYVYIDKDILDMSLDVLNSEHIQFKYEQKGKDRYLHFIDIGNNTLRRI